MPNVEYYRLEDYTFRQHGPTNERRVRCSFKTDRFGYLQIGWDEGGTYEFLNEPDLNMLPKEDQKYVKHVCAIVWRLVFDGPVRMCRVE